MFEPEVKRIEPMSVAYLGMRGPYAQIPQAMGQVYGWVAQHGLQPAGMPHAVYYTAPDETPESEAMWEILAPLGGDVAPVAPDETGVGVKRTDAMTVASAVHAGPYETVGATYEALGKWVAGQGYTMAGPPMELYLNDPGEVGPEQVLTEIRFPIVGV